MNEWNRNDYFCSNITYLLFFFLVFLSTICMSSFLLNFMGSNKEEKIVHIASGFSTREIAQKLEKEEVIRSTILFEVLAKWRKLDGKLKAGHYFFSPHVTINEVLDKLAQGKTMTLSVTIPEGYRLEQIADLLAQKKIVDKQDFLAEAAKTDYPFAFLQGVEAKGLEGYLFPTTYRIDYETGTRQLIMMMLKTFEYNLPENWAHILQEKKMSLHEAVTLASIVEKEGMRDKERPLIAAVFYNRLDRGIRLESCVTVQYALGKHKSVLSYQDTKIDSLYNTYLHNGLPPGPIACPGKTSLEAVFHPAKTEAMFFVAKGNGTHFFSKTYDEHLRNSQKRGM